MASKHMRKCSASLAIREIKIKTTIRYHLTPVRMGKINKAGNHKCWRRCGEREPSYTVAGNVNWCSHSGKLRGVFKKFKIDLPYNPAIALLGIYPKDSDAMKRRDTCTPMFIAAMATIAKLWKEPRCPTKECKFLNSFLGHLDFSPFPYLHSVPSAQRPDFWSFPESPGSS